MRYDYFLYTNRGGQACNEDRAAAGILGGSAFFVLADGLGGHRFGEKAAECVAGALMDAWKQQREKGPDSGLWLKEAFLEANEALLTLQAQTGGSMKSTAVALDIADGRASWAHVGDSRLYYLTSDRIRQLTRDHSVTYKKYRSGEISRHQMAFDEDRSSLLRVMGERNRCIPDCRALKGCLHSGDAFLLCSDGFWEYLAEEEIWIDRLKAETAKEWTELMLLRMPERIRPDTDNLTALAVIAGEEEEHEAI